jgi:hypothetical protein
MHFALSGISNWTWSGKRLVKTGMLVSEKGVKVFRRDGVKSLPSPPGAAIIAYKSTKEVIYGYVRNRWSSAQDRNAGR